MPAAHEAVGNVCKEADPKYDLARCSTPRPDRNDAEPDTRPVRLGAVGPSRGIPGTSIARTRGVCRVAIRPAHAVQRFRALRITGMQGADLLAPKLRDFRIAVECWDRGGAVELPAIAEFVGIAARQVGIPIRLALRIRSDRPVSPLREIAVEFAGNAGCVRGHDGPRCESCPRRHRAIAMPGRGFARAARTEYAPPSSNFRR